MQGPDVLTWNREAWDRQVRAGNRWTRPVSPEEVAQARAGTPRVVLTPSRPVPQRWMQPLVGARVLCLASGGGQQGPLLAAAGAEVTVFDNSPAQLDQDRAVAEREGLSLRLEQGDMADLSRFPDQSFDWIFNPCSTCFVPDLAPIWRECARVLRPGGALLSGWCNPWGFLFDPQAREAGELRVAFSLPHSDWDQRDHPSIRALIEAGEALEYSHSLEAQLGGQCAAGLAIVDLYEDRYTDEADPLSARVPPFVATRAIRLPQP